jgi:pyruvate dehydrogenase E2 component (dihydrolipoamide acetyltransferase)
MNDRVIAAIARETTLSKIEVKVPDIGDFHDVPIIEILVKPGDAVKPEQSLMTLESDKAAMDVPSPAAGVVGELRVKIGDKVSQGSLILTLEDSAAPAAKPEEKPVEAKPPAAATEVKVPDIGDFKDVPIIEILVKPGETVKAEQPLMTLESDKAAMEVPSPADGVVGELRVKVGDKVSQGTVILTLAASNGAAPAAAAQKQEAKTEPPEAQEPPAKSAQAPPPAEPPSKLADFSGVHAGPSVRRLARELGVDLAGVAGSGEKGRITKEDLVAALAGSEPRGGATGGAALPEVATVDFAKFGPIETKPLSRIKKISGPRLHASWINIPHVTHTDEADVTELEAFRKSLDDAAKADKKAPYRVSLLPLLMKAAVATLKTYPVFNSALSPDKASLIHRLYWNIGVAVDTPEGLVVAVVKDVDKKGVIELSRELGALSAKAREGKLSPNEMQGASFTISSLGGIGGTAFTPIVNAPEVAILGVVRAKMAPVWDGKAFQPRLMLPLCLSYDHRVIDGAAAARFMRHLCDVAEDMRRVLL